MDPDLPFLAATPDGLVDKDILIEVKCPYTGRKSKIRPGKKFPFLQRRNGKLALKTSHNYYDQVQGQLLIAKRSVCYFIVYTKVALKRIVVTLDEAYCRDCLVPKLEAFFDKYYVPFLASNL